MILGSSFLVVEGGGRISLELLRSRSVSFDSRKPRYQKTATFESQNAFFFMHLKKDNMIKESRSLLKYLDSYFLYEYENYI